MEYKIISTGSKGNAVLLDRRILIDCGVQLKKLFPYICGLQLVLLTHRHGDHYNPRTVAKLAELRPGLRWGCCGWMVSHLISAGVRPEMIDLFGTGIVYVYPGESLALSVEPFEVPHDVPNCGYKIGINGERVLYVTDAANLNGIEAPGFDLYMVEANYVDEDIQRRIDEKRAAGQFAYEARAREQHLSKAQADDFICSNIRHGGRYVYLHEHSNCGAKMGGADNG